MNSLGTKAETLKILYKKLENADILPQYSFTVGEWIQEKQKIIEDFPN